ncbi:8033_t:CDS:2 [Funneliformis mosseae]|uniref:8033_t:CDS:1 n=1 Tax=Funneliformis mosseae TaxID=27381 RepID=A0A9N9ATV3_FUNMO|nr:8033_t:CDS:2 [Funneliformis mosseae]
MHMILYNNRVKKKQGSYKTKLSQLFQTLNTDYTARIHLRLER